MSEHKEPQFCGQCGRPLRLEIPPISIGGWTLYRAGTLDETIYAVHEVTKTMVQLPSRRERSVVVGEKVYKCDLLAPRIQREVDQ